jgi:DNA-binding response OmpR family regulator
MKKILIVEDEFILQMMLEKMVQKMGHQVVSKAKSGAVAIDVAKNESPDLILMDIKIIGDIDGIETIKKIREFSDVPVLYLSGNTDPDTRKRASETAPMDFIIKPFEYQDLMNAVNRSFE